MGFLRGEKLGRLSLHYETLEVEAEAEGWHLILASPSPMAQDVGPKGMTLRLRPTYVRESVMHQMKSKCFCYPYSMLKS